MIRNYIKIAWRNLWNNKVYSAINIIGLSIGLTVFVLVLLYVNREHRYDRWDPKLEQVYRVGVSQQNEDGLEKSPSVQYPLGTFLAEECPEVALMSRVRVAHGESLLATERHAFYDSKVISADSNFFAVFPYEFIQGDAQTALDQPNTAVLTKEMGDKLFGSENPVGKVIKQNNRELYTVTGVVDKQGPSHLDFDVCLSYQSTHFANNWFMKNHDTYVVMKPHSSILALQQKAKVYYGKRYATSYGGMDGDPQLREDPLKWLAEKKKITDLDVFFEPVSNIHLQPEGFQEWSALTPAYDFNANNQMPVMIFTLIGLLVLSLACVNYTNMAIARAGRRAQEFGMRKVMGATRKQLIIQFLTEALIQCMLAVFLALFLTMLLKEVLNRTFLLDLQLWNSIYPQQNQQLILQLIVILLAVTFVSGVYPAFVLSSYRSSKVLKGDMTKTTKGRLLRNGLIVLQYSIATCFIISTLIISLQLHFMQNNDPGFNADQVLRIQTANATQLFPDQPGDRSNDIKNMLVQIPGIKQVTTGDSYPGMPYKGTQVANYEGGNTLPMQFSLINFDFFKVLQMEIKKGRDFSPTYARDTADAAIINETAARTLGWENPIGKELEIVGKKYHVIGMLKDSYLSGYETEVLPQIYMIGVTNPQNFSGHRNVLIKVDGSRAQEALQRVIAFWKTVEPEYPVRYSWLDQDFAKLMEKYERFGKLTDFLTLAALSIAVMGIFALSTFAAEQRTKEIGIRKVMGASMTTISTLLSKDFIKLVLIAIIVASPIAWWAMNKWLQDFAYHIEIQWWMFGLAGILAMMIALLTVSFQAIKTAIANPVDSLRTE